MSPRKGASARRKPRRRTGRNTRPARGGDRNPLVTLVGLVALVITAVAVGIGIGSGASRTASDGELENVVTNLARKWEGARVKVEVLNGGGVSGMAGAATERLRSAGFDVVSFGNATTFDPERPSQVIDRVGRLDAAQAVAEALGIDNVLSDPDPNLYVDVTVVVGGAWTVQQRSKSDVAAQRPMWDPRTWFGS